MGVLDSGGFVVSDSGFAAIRRVRPDGTIEVAAGTGTSGFGGDGGPATEAQISDLTTVSPLPGGGFLIADTLNHRIRRVGPDGVITTVAGTGRQGSSGDGGLATNARLTYPEAVEALGDGTLLIADTGSRRIRRVGPDGVITTVAGTGAAGASGDGGPATAARLSEPTDVASLPDGGFVIADPAGPSDTSRLRRVLPDGTIITLVKRRYDSFRRVALGPDGALLVVASPEVLRVPLDGAPEHVAGRCPPPPWRRVSPGDGKPARRAQAGVLDLAVLPDGGLLLADIVFSRIRRIRPDGIIETVAGGGGMTGPVDQHDSPCGGASPEYGAWNFFGIIAASSRGRSVVVRLATTLAAEVTLTVRRRGGSSVRRSRVHVKAGVRRLRVGRVARGRYTVRAVGRHDGLRARHSRTVRVR